MSSLSRTKKLRLFLVVGPLRGGVGVNQKQKAIKEKHWPVTPPPQLPGGGVDEDHQQSKAGPQYRKHLK